MYVTVWDSMPFSGSELWGDLGMGFYYLLLLFIGVVLLVIGVLKGFFATVKKAMFLLVTGFVFIVTSLLLLMPGSSDVISKLLTFLFY